MTNTLNSRRPGNPNVRQTLLAKASDEYSYAADPRAWKRQKLDDSISSTVTSNGASTSYGRGPAPSNVSEPDIQVIEPPRSANNRSSLSNDAEIIDLGTSSDDLGERVPRPAKSSSPDPIRLPPLRTSRPHPFETRPAEYRSYVSDKGKGHAQQSSKLVVEGSEEEEDIEEFTPTPPMGRPANAKKSQEIPPRIVQERRKIFESVPARTPAAVWHSTGKGVNSVDLATGTIISKMKKKDEVSTR